MHVHEFTCAFRHRRIRRSSRGIEGRARSNKRVAFSLPRRGEERSNHEVNEKSSGLQRLCGVRKISQETPFSPPIDSQKLPLVNRSSEDPSHLKLNVFLFRKEQLIEVSCYSCYHPSTRRLSSITQSLNSPFKWIVCSGCCVLVHIASFSFLFFSFFFFFRLKRNSTDALFVKWIWYL